ncbi:Protein of unknown function [Bacillus mycoides]|uniref:Uncharacterized protein n=1 Tax=Bacillus mycoides TaxID=1405 RepID=A0A1G4EKP1_BACMY|nr:hypothetical protein [Bacillus cereus]SCB68368.1 Protein of unknown function [Bacillus mycoides]
MLLSSGESNKTGEGGEGGETLKHYRIYDTLKMIKTHEENEFSPWVLVI